jgi:formate hydrogenlyase subunit 3/multisubunit Na+/H+ antiporter MnhD subunit
MIPWILIIIAILIITLAIVFIATIKNKKKHEPDYYTFFVMGLIFLPLGIIGMMRDNYSVFFILGLVFIAVGLVNKDKWRKDTIFNRNSKKRKK